MITHFVLSEEDWIAFMKAIDDPPEPTPELVELFRSTPPWGEPEKP